MSDARKPDDSTDAMSWVDRLVRIALVVGLAFLLYAASLPARR